MDFQIRESMDLWTRLKSDSRPLILYGMGDGADKIISALATIGREPDDFFASDDFVRGQSFHGKRVHRFSEITQKYRDFVILVAFASSLEDVMNRIFELDSQYEVYVPDVPVVPDGHLFDMQYVQAHNEEFKKAFALLADEESKRVFMDLIHFKISGKLQYLRQCFSLKSEAMCKILHSETYRRVLDLGAYNGDSIRELAGFSPQLAEVYAAEPDEKNFRKLCEYAKEEKRFEIIPLHVGAYFKRAVLAVSVGAGRGSRIGAGSKTAEMQMEPPDSMADGKIDFIKYDVEGAEKEALMGSIQTMRHSSPELLVSAYHRNEDLFALILQIHQMMPEYRFYLRKHPSIPAWDINLYCVFDAVPERLMEAK